MKIIKKYLAAALLLLLGALCLSGCGSVWDAPYVSLNGEGYNVSVRFDANGGLFAGTKDVYIVDVFSPENGSAFRLLAPEDPIRAEGAFTASRNGYFLAGWYTGRTPRADENGTALDDYGVPCSESGREQGYTYSGRWDFETDEVSVDPNGSYNAEEPVLTLYAAWIPYINYEFYQVNTETGETSHIGTVQSIDLEIPEWNTKTGRLDMKKFPTQEGRTFDAAFTDAALTQPLTETVFGRDGFVDYDTGTLNAESVSIYTTWLEGTWYKIYTAEQFYSNARLDGNYLICEDLDFEGAVWSPTLVKGKFSGKIYGNGHTFSNITAVQADNSLVYGGLFGTLEDGAVIRDLNLENVSFTIEAGSRLQGAVFGLLTGSVSSGAELENVTVSGNLYISTSCYPQSDYTIGLLCGSGSSDGVTYAIECAAAGDNTESVTVTVNDDGSVSVTFH